MRPVSMLSLSPFRTAFISSLIYLALVQVVQVVEAFTPTFTQPPVQCAPFTITWELQGGDQRTGPPYTLLLIPFESSRPIIEQLPDEVWDAASGEGSYTIQNLPLAAGERFIVVLDDGFARAAGEVSPILTISSDASNSTCLDSLPPLPSAPPVSLYTLSTDSPSQCGQLSIEWDEAVSTTGGVEIRGFIPGGQAFTLDRVSDATIQTYDWTVNVRENQSFVLLFGGEGGGNYTASSPLIQVQGVTNGNCITTNSPSRTATEVVSDTQSEVASGTQSEVASDTQAPIVGGPTVTPELESPSNKVKTGAIAGGIVGGLAFVAIIAISLFFYIALKKQRKGEVNLSSTGNASSGRGKGRGGFSTKRSVLQGFSFASTQNRSETSFRELDPNGDTPNDFGERRDRDVGAGAIRGKYGDVVAPYVVPSLPSSAPPVKNKKSFTKEQITSPQTTNGYPPPPPKYKTRQPSVSGSNTTPPRNIVSSNRPTLGSSTLLSSNYPTTLNDTTPSSSLDRLATSDGHTENYNARFVATPSPLPPIPDREYNPSPSQWPNEKSPRPTSPVSRPIPRPISPPPSGPPPPPPTAPRPNRQRSARSARSVASSHNPFNSPSGDDIEEDEWDGSCNSHPYALATSPHTERPPLPLPISPSQTNENAPRNELRDPDVSHPFAVVGRKNSAGNLVASYNNNDEDDDEEVTDAYAFAPRTRGQRAEPSTSSGQSGSRGYADQRQAPSMRQPMHFSPLATESGQRTRFVRHRDAGSVGVATEDDDDDDESVSEDDGRGGRRRVRRRRRERRTRVVELPPHYSEAVGRR